METSTEVKSWPIYNAIAYLDPDFDAIPAVALYAEDIEYMAHRN